MICGLEVHRLFRLATSPWLEWTELNRRHLPRKGSIIPLDHTPLKFGLGGIRTHVLSVKSRVPYLAWPRALVYIGVGGFEPPATGISGPHSSPELHSLIFMESAGIEPAPALNFSQVSSLIRLRLPSLTPPV